MSKKLWNKGSDVDKDIEKYLASDIAVDQKLVKYEVIANIAHAKMLHKLKILTKSELKKILKTLNELAALNKKGKFVLQQSDEDVHTAVENYLTKKLGNTGKKVHTYRSRNDLAVTTLRLYNKDKLKETKKALLTLCKALIKLSKKYKQVPMPGYTHLQKAMLSSIAVWASSFVESLLDDLEVLEQAYVLNDQNPLGSAASYGVPDKIDREYTAKLLGFSKLQNNVLYCQNSRGKIESTVLNSLSQIMITLSKLCQDIIIFSTSEFGYLSLSDKVSTGSSIMPQKKNPDVAELVKGNASLVLGYEFQVKNVITALSSGYAKETQVIKEPTIKGLEITLGSLNAMNILISSLKVNKARCVAACTPEIFATDHAYELVKQGMPFREAYKKVAKNLNKLPKLDPIKALKKREKNKSFYSLSLVELEKLIKEKEKAI